MITPITIKISKVCPFNWTLHRLTLIPHTPIYHFLWFALTFPLFSECVQGCVQFAGDRLVHGPGDRVRWLEKIFVCGLTQKIRHRQAFDYFKSTYPRYMDTTDNSTFVQLI